MTTSSERSRRKTLTIVVENTRIDATFAGSASTVAEMIHRIKPVRPQPPQRPELDQTQAPKGAMLIPLTGGMVAIVDAEDYPALSQYNWQFLPRRNGYAVRKEYAMGKQTTVYMHRQIAGPTGELVTDHKNGNGLDNRRRNLRCVTQGVNNSNRYPYIDISDEARS